LFFGSSDISESKLPVYSSARRELLPA